MQYHLEFQIQVMKKIIADDIKKVKIAKKIAMKYCIFEGFSESFVIKLQCLRRSL